MFEFHADRKRYFDIQVLNAEKYVIPFIEEKFPVKAGMRILEIGCGEGGVLKAFVNKGCEGVGVELDAPRVVDANKFLTEDIAAGRLRFVVKDIYEVEVKKDVTVADIMVQNPIAVLPQNSLRELINLMGTHRVAGMPVVDETGKYIGEVNVLNLLKVGVPNYVMMLDNLSFLASYEPLENLFGKQDILFVKDIMTTGDVFIRPESSIIEAVFLMFSQNKRYLSVVKDEKLVGLVTAMDILIKVITV